MIIKSLRRKEASFDQLVYYINLGAGKNDYYLAHNFLCDPTDTESVIKQFEDNSEYLPPRKNGNYIYHEIISLPTQSTSLENANQILEDLAQQYIQKRCPETLAYARIHNNTDKPHIHLAISANKLMDSKRMRLSKKQFRDIQIELEQYKLEKYPELGNQKFYAMDHHSEKAKTKHAEHQITKAGKVTKKQRVITILSEALDITISFKELDQQLKKHQLALYQRGKTVGVMDLETNKKYRLKTLALDDQYQQFKQAVTQMEKQRQQMQQIRQSRKQHDYKNQQEPKP